MGESHTSTPAGRGCDDSHSRRKMALNGLEQAGGDRTDFQEVKATRDEGSDFRLRRVRKEVRSSTERRGATSDAVDLRGSPKTRRAR